MHHHFFVGGHGRLLARGALGASLAAGTLFVEGLADRTNVEGLDLPGRLQKLCGRYVGNILKVSYGIPEQIFVFLIFCCCNINIKL